MDEQREAPQPSKYARLPAPIRPEDMRTIQDVAPAAGREGRARPRDRLDAAHDRAVHLSRRGQAEP